MTVHQRPPGRFRVTRDVLASEVGNHLKRDAVKGEVFFECRLPTYGCVDYGQGEALTELPDEYPFFQFPRSALERLEPSGADDG